VGIGRVKFDPDTHTYHSPRGLWLPGVTRVLADGGYVKGMEWFTPKSRNRGKGAHYACQLLDENAPDVLTMAGALEVMDLDEELQGNLAGYLKFKVDYGFKPKFIETPLWSDNLNVAGTIDRWGHLKDGSTALVELKSWVGQGAKPKPAAELQTAGYDILFGDYFGTKAVTDRRIVLALPGDGSYRAYECADPMDYVIFRALATIWWDRAKRGLVDRGGNSDVEIAA
jgi:hypothetical protein